MNYPTVTNFNLLFSIILLFSFGALAQINFSQSNLNYNGLVNPNIGFTSLMYGPDGRLYVAEYPGAIKILTIQRNSATNYVVTDVEVLDGILTMQDHNDDGTLNGNVSRETIGLTVAGTPTNPVIYVSSSDFRIGAGTGGGNGDVGLDTNSGVITRFSWNGSSWDVVDLVRGLPRSEENHATNGLEFVTINGTDYLIVAQGGHTNGGAPSTNFVYQCEYALSGAILAVDLTALESMPILDDNGRAYIYDLPTLDDPTRENVNPDGSPASEDPNDPGYSPLDVNDPWGGNDGLNQAILVSGGPVQILSPGYRNAYDLVVTQSGALYVTDNGANGGWGGFPENEGGASVTNNYDPAEPGSSSSSGGEQINNVDHLELITTDLQTYSFGSFYGGHPNPTRANPIGAGLYTDNGTTAVFRTVLFDPDGSTPGSSSDPDLALPVNWPPVTVANPVEGDWRAPGILLNPTGNPDGPDDVPITLWGTNTNGIDEYTASNFGGAMQGDLLAGVNSGIIRRVELNPDGSLLQLTSSFLSGIGGNALGISCNSDTDVFPGTIWAGTLNGKIVVFEPQDFVSCLDPSDPLYDANADYDADGYTNQDEEDNETDHCNGGSQPDDFDKDQGGTLVSDLYDLDDDFDDIADAIDPFQLGDPTQGGSDAFTIPLSNDLLNDQQGLGGIFGLGMTGLMNNGDTGANWLDWLDDKGQGPNPDDVLGGNPGLMTSHMTSGTAYGSTNTQEKGYQYGVQTDVSTGIFTVSGGMVNFGDEFSPLQLYGNTAAVNGELGFFIGDGTQSNYIKFVVTIDGFTALQEITDVPQTSIEYDLAENERPSSVILFYFVVDPLTGLVNLEFQIDQGTKISLGSITAEGSILQAIQDPNIDLAVGFIGTSGTVGVELEGTWDFLNVEGENPYILQPIEDIVQSINAPTDQFDLNNYFNDNNGNTNLTYSIEQNSNPNINATISGSIISILYPSTPQTTNIIVRATDLGANYIEQSFMVTVNNEVTIVSRVNASGDLVIANDGGPNWEYNGTTGSSTGNSFAVNTGNIYQSGLLYNDRHSSIPAYIDEVTYNSIFAQERWDDSAIPEMEFTFTLVNGEYQVNIFLGNSYVGTSQVGQRIFSIELENSVVKSNLDLISEFGNQSGGMLSFPISVNDGELNIKLLHVVENPLVNAIEILNISGLQFPVINVEPIVDQNNLEGDIISNLGVIATGGDPNVNFSYSISGQPLGVEIEPTNGLIYGTIESGTSIGGPNNDGIHNVIVTVDKLGSNPVNILFDWTTTSTTCTWNNLADSNYSRFQTRNEIIGDKIYVMGGWLAGINSNTHLDIYDIANDTWNTGSDLLLPVTHMGSVVVGDEIWLFGGFDGNIGNPTQLTDKIQIYNTITNTWSYGPDLPKAIGSCAATVNGNKVHLFGGLESDIQTDIDDHYILDLTDIAAGWTTAAPMINARNHHSAETLDGIVYAIGGQTGHQGNHQDVAFVEAYDSNTDTWTSLSNLPIARSHFEPGTTVYNGKIIIVGGQEETTNFSDDITQYDPQIDQWSELCKLPNNRMAPVAHVYGDKLIVSGGGINGTSNLIPTTEWFQLEPSVSQLVWVDKNENENYTPRHECQLVQAGDSFFLLGGRESDLVEIYNYSTDSWITLPPAPKLFSHFQAIEYQGFIWVIGALEGNNYPYDTPVSNIWLFDTVSHEWIQGPAIPAERVRGATGSIVYNDKFYIVGGNKNGHAGEYVNWFDEYDPATGNWTILTNAPNARDHFNAVLIGDKLYAVGGRQTGDPEDNIQTPLELGKPLVPEVDVYNFSTGEWQTLPSNQNIPTPRAGASAVNFKNKLVVLGGEVYQESVYGENITGALKITEEFDPTSGLWKRISDLNYPRHGIQALVSGDGIHVVSGSPVYQGGVQKNMEYFGMDNPIGAAINSSQIIVPSSVEFNNQYIQAIPIEVANGDMGIFISSIEIAGINPSDFLIQTGNLTNSLLKANSVNNITVQFVGTEEDKSANLTINYGSNSSINIALTTTSTTCTWNNLADSNYSRFQTRNEIIGDKIYVMGGWLAGINSNTHLDIYDIANDTWNTGSDLLLPVTHMGSVVVGDEIWLFGGFDGNIGNPTQLTDKIQIYNTITNTWSYGPDLPKAIGSCAATVNGNKVHLFGGLESDIQTDIDDHYILDLTDIAAGWTTAAPMINARNHHSAETLDGIVYAIGGQTGHQGNHQDVAFVEAYDSNTDTWTSLSNLPIARSHFEPGTTVYNGKIIIVGGQEETTNFSDDITQYDPQIDQWSELCKLPNNRMAPVAHVYGDKLFVSGGGINGTSNLIPTTEWLQLDPGTPQFPPLTVDPIVNQTNAIGEDIGIVPVTATGGDPTVAFGYGITGAPEGLSIDTNTGEITGIIAAGATAGGTDGVHDIMVTVSKAGSTSVTTNFTWTVTGPFTIDAIADQTNGIGNTIGFFSKAHGGDISQPISYGITGQPLGISINSSTGEITGTIDTNAITGGTNSDGIHDVVVTASRNGSADVQAQFVWIIEGGTGLPWLEDFEDLSNGTTIDNGATAWTSSRDAGLFEVTNGSFLTSGNSNTIGAWTSEVVNINGTVSVSLDVDDGDSFKEPADFIRAYYIVDGGSPILFGSVNGNISAQSFTATDITGTTIQIIVEADVSTTNEVYLFDNVSIISVVVDPPLTVDPIVNQTNAIGEDIGIVPVTATGGDPTVAFGYGITGAPEGLSIDTNTGEITGIIAAGATAGGTDGVHDVMVTVSKAGSTSVTTNFTWTVTGPFTIDAIADQTNGIGNTIGFFSKAHGGDISQPISYGITGQPLGISINSSTGEITGTIDTNAITGGTNSDGIHDVVVTASRNGSADVQAQFVWIIEGGTGLPWLEDFEDLSNGTTIDNGATAWTSSRDAGLFEVTNGSFLTSGNSNTIGAWTSEVVNINGTVSVSLDVDDGDSFKEPADFIRAYYIVDGGSPILFGSVNGNISAQSFTATDITGTTIQIIVEADVSTTNEVYLFDNVSIISVVVDPPLTVDPIVNQTNAIGEDIGIVPVTATGGDPTVAFGYGITGAPEGLSIDTNTGEITGIIAAGATAGGTDGVHDIMVTVSKAGSTSVTTNFTWTVTGPFTIDAIADQTNGIGNTIGFFSKAHGGDISQPISYGITGQPLGISINSSTGEITGTIDTNAITGGTNSDGIHDVVVTASRNGSADVQAQFVWIIEGGTGLPWLEDFEDLSNGTTIDNGATAWTSSRDAGLFEVTNGSFLTSGNSNTIGAWTSEVVNINGTVSVSLDVDDGDSFKEPADFIRAYYIVDGGSPILFGSVNGNISAQSFTATDITGTTIQIIVEADVSTINEIYLFDNVQVVSSSQGAPPIANLKASLSGSRKIDAINIYPNPTKGILYLEIPSETSLNIQSIIIFDISGKLVKTIDINVIKNMNLLQINLDGLNAGIYNIIFRSKTSQLSNSLRVIKIN